MPKVTVYTDGACSGNPGPGGYAAVLVSGERTREVVGHVDEATNGRMELLAVIMGLSALKFPCEVTIISDAQYVVKGINEWLPGWIARGWRKADRKPVENRDLWQKVQDLMAVHQVTAQWIEGHTGEPGNERANHLAQSQVRA